MKALLHLFNNKSVLFYIVIFAAVGYSVVFSLIALHRFWQYEAWYYDFGIFAQAIYSVSRFQSPIIDHFVVGGKPIFADHFHPIIFIFSPLFWFTNKAEILLVAQSFTVGASAIFIYLTAQKVLNKEWWALLLTYIYFSFIGLHFALISEFHEITLLPLPLAIFLYALVTKRTSMYIAATVSVLLVKESTFIIPAFFCLLEVLKSKGKWRRLNIFLTVVSMVYGLVAVKVIIPYFAEGSYQYGSLLSLSNIEKLFDSPLKITTIWQTLASYGFLPLLAPELLFPVIFNWFTRFSEDSVSRHSLGLHYNAEIAPTLLFASIIAIKRIQSWLKKSKLVTLLLLGVTIWAGYFSIFYLNSPIRLAVLPDFYKHTQSFEFLNTLVKNVPESGSVMAQTNLATRLIHRNPLMLRMNYEQYSPDWIVVDKRIDQSANNFYGATLPGQAYPTELFTQLATDPNYKIYYQQNEQIIYQKIN